MRSMRVPLKTYWYFTDKKIKAKNADMATTKKMFIFVPCDVHFWCQVKKKKHTAAIFLEVFSTLVLRETIYDPITLRICIMQIRKYL